MTSYVFLADSKMKFVEIIGNGKVDWLLTLTLTDKYFTELFERTLRIINNVNIYLFLFIHWKVMHKTYPEYQCCEVCRNFCKNVNNWSDIRNNNPKMVCTYAKIALKIFLQSLVLFICLQFICIYFNVSTFVSNVIIFSLTSALWSMLLKMLYRENDEFQVIFEFYISFTM